MKSPSDIEWASFPRVQIWLNKLLRYANASELQPGVGYRIKRQTNGTTIELLGARGSGAGSASEETFTANETGDLEVIIRGGTVIWGSNQFQKADSAAIAVPANSTDFKVWLAINNPYDAGAVDYDFGPGGWTGFPAQPVIAGRKYLLLCTILSDATKITEINVDDGPGWHGGDITWPDVVPEDDDFAIKPSGIFGSFDVAVNGGLVFWHDVDVIVPEGTVITIPASSIWQIYLQMSDPFLITPSISIMDGVSIPASTAPPARQYLPLATVSSNATNITGIRRHFHGGTWPPIYGYHS